MPMVPPTRGIEKLMNLPSETNLLMAAADMHRNGALIQAEPELRSLQGPERPRLPAKRGKGNRPLKVVK